MAGAKDESTFLITHDGVAIKVYYSGGSSSSLTFTTSYDSHAKGELQTSRAGGSYRQGAVPESRSAIRPMQIVLRHENISDLQAKEGGINREHQTGDDEFDREVYIDSPTVDEDVLQAVLGDDVRAAVLALFRVGVRRITVDDARGNVEGYLHEFTRAQEDPDRANVMVSSFSKLALAFPPLRASGGTHAETPYRTLVRVGGVLAGVLFFALIPIFLVLASGFDCSEPSSDGEGSTLKDGCGAAPVLGLLAAVVVGALASAIATRFVVPKLRGRSDSAARMAGLSWTSFGLAAEITFLVVTTTLWATRAH
jgi:hypothetical protein